MNDGSGMDRLSGWQARLLRRIEDLRAECGRVRREIPHTPWPQRPDPSFDQLRLRQSELERDLDGLKVRARASGIPETEIEKAEHSAQWRGFRDDNRPAGSIQTGGESPARTQMMDAIADDVWTVEHMAAVAGFREWQPGNDVSKRLATVESRQHERKMVALLHRVEATASLAELTDDERTTLWNRDEAGWIRLFQHTVYAYNSEQLERRWQENCPPHSGTQIADIIRRVAAERHDPADSGLAPPTPRELIDRAVAALEADYLAWGVDYDEYLFYISMFGPDSVINEHTPQPATDPTDQHRGVKKQTAGPSDDLHADAQTGIDAHQLQAQRDVRTPAETVDPGSSEDLAGDLIQAAGLDSGGPSCASTAITCGTADSGHPTQTSDLGVDL
ncbi:hypothetical protein [Nocardia sp. NPDC047038]|uniref:hypothetical protein n=1 Tax=Nocardia sp. NPDC047038 TaxID=3154338 RepID=UPI0033DD0528